jgi:iron complex outermembrane receptor protein
MHLKKIISAVLLAYSSTSYADELRLPDVSVNANPIIESIDIDDYSSTSATISEKQLKDF